jgi:hypothetical protein
VTNGIGNCLLGAPTSLQIDISLVHEMKDGQAPLMIKETRL